MSAWGIGDHHDSDEVHALKDKLRNKDAQLATLQSQLIKKDDDANDFRSAFNEVVDKLRREADRVLELEATLTRRNDEFQNERLTRQNVEAALASTQQSLKASEQTTQELYSTLDTLSSRAESSGAHKSRLERDNLSLQQRVRELQMEIAAKETTEQTQLRQSQTGRNNTGARGRPRSSSVSTFRVTALEREVVESNTRSTKQAMELADARSRLASTQDALVRLENEKVAMERRLNKHLQEVQAEWNACKDELNAMQEKGGEDAAAREESLLERLSDEEKRVVALEDELARSAVKHGRELVLVQDELERTFGLLEEEKKKVDDVEARLLEVVSEKEEALNERDQAYSAAQNLKEQIKVVHGRIRELEDKRTAELQAVSPPSPPNADTETAATVARLLGAIDRLRGERDQLRRDIEFLRAENKFAVEDLKTKLATAVAIPPSPTETDGVMPPPSASACRTLWDDKLRRFERTAVVFALVSQYVEAERCKDVDRMLQDLAVSRSGVRQAHDDVKEKDTCICELRGVIETSDVRLSELQMTFDRTTASLQAAEARISDLSSTIECLREETSRERASHEDTGATLAQTEAQLANVSHALAEAEEQRDALALQVHHTEQDLGSVRKELVEADLRYGQQLCAMSSGEPTRALRDQIETLEQRVLRRTEQIGVHQHDIKRLETNLRLQEERIAEMTTELEVIQGEKEAMVEDCRTTREERNEALQRCEGLEEKAEHLEEEKDLLKLAISSAEEREKALAEDARVLAAQLAEQEAEHGSLRSRLAEAEVHETSVLGEITQLREERANIAAILERRTCRLDSLLEERDSAGNEALQATVALAAVYIELRGAATSFRQAEEAKSLAQANLAALCKELDQREAEIIALRQEFKALSEQSAENRATDIAQFATVKAGLDDELDNLRRAHAELQSLHQQHLEELRKHREDNSHSSDAATDLRAELSRLQEIHAQETADLRQTLEQVTTDLQQAERLYKETVALHQHAEEASIATTRELESQLAETTEKLNASDSTNEDLASLRSRHEGELEDLRQTLGRTTDDLVKMTEAYEDLKAKYDQLSNELVEVNVRVTEKTQQYEQTVLQIDRLQADHADELTSWQGRLDSFTTELSTAQRTISELEDRCHQFLTESASVKEDLGHQLSSSLEEVEYLKATLQREMDLHTRDQKQHELELHAAREKCANAEATQEKLVQEFSILREHWEDASTTLKTLQDEKTGLQFETTNLEAEIQRLKSLQRFLESQAKDSELQIATLREDLSKIRVDLGDSEKACKAAEATLSMREIQHEQTLGALRRDISALRANPKLEDKIAELEERHLEMEELLRSKCLEIEENDDRFIEMLKEKKKLTNKIESLTRKVHNLQSKLASLNDANALPIPAEQTHAVVNERSTSRTPPISSVSTAPSKSVARATPSIPPMPVYTSATADSHPRVVSGPSVLPRPKTPETRPQQAVFRARTPEARGMPSQSQAPVAAASSSASSQGRKRRTPDDFEVCESVPPQGFTVESMPSSENTTPRARRTLQTIRSGFTPVRNHATRPTPAQLSPTRRATTGAALPSAIADVTNSPRVAPQLDGSKTSKRGWLGKIRNVPAQASTSRSISSRPGPVFERVQ